MKHYESRNMDPDPGMQNWSKTIKLILHLDLESMELYPLSVSVTMRYFYLILRAICKLWHPLPQRQGIPYLYSYNYIIYAILPATYIATRHVLPSS